MKYLITLSLIVISLSDEGYNKFIINIKQQLSKQVVDFPENYERYIKYLVGYTNVIKTTVNLLNAGDYLKGQGFPYAVYMSCLRVPIRKDTFSEKSDYISGLNNLYSLNQYVVSCYRINNTVSIIAIKGKYSGTMQNIIEEKPYCIIVQGMKRCEPGKFSYESRRLNDREMEFVKRTLKIKYFQETLDHLNRLI